MNKDLGVVFEKIVDQAGKRGFVRLYGYALPHATWVCEGGRCSRAWHYHAMLTFEIAVGGGKLKMRVKRTDLMTFLSSSEEISCRSWDELFKRLSEIIERERIERLDMEKLVVEPLVWVKA